MNVVDRLIQKWRFHKASAWVIKGSRVLDVGAHDGDFLAYLGSRISPSVGIDPEAKADSAIGEHRLLAGYFPERTPEGTFDVASLLAVVEHLDDEALTRVGRALVSSVRAGGSVIVTIPSPAADGILELMQQVRLIDGMDLEAHHHLRVDALVQRWSACGLKPSYSRRFEFGLNNLIVFEVPGSHQHEDSEGGEGSS